MFIYPQHAPAGGPLGRPRFQAHLVLETTSHFRLIVHWKRALVSGSSCIGQFCSLNCSSRRAILKDEEDRKEKVPEGQEIRRARHEPACASPDPNADGGTGTGRSCRPKPIRDFPRDGRMGAPWWQTWRGGTGGIHDIRTPTRNCAESCAQAMGQHGQRRKSENVKS